MARRRVVESKTDSSGVVMRRHRPDYQIVLYVGLLMIIGLIVLYSISPARVEMINANTGSTLDTVHFMEKQLINLGAGLVAFIVAALIPIAFWKKNASWWLLGGLAACFLLALLGLFMDGGIVLKSGGATRWFNFGITSFQPAELLKFGLLLFAAVFLGKRMREGKVNDLQTTLLPLGILTALAVLFIVVFQKDMGTGLTLIGLLVVMLYVAGLNRKWLALGTIGLVGAVMLLIVTSPHRMERVMTFFNPTSATDESSYHITQALIALGSGGLFGKGLGQGVQAFGYLPEAVNDSIFAILGETFGFIGIVVILVIFAALLHRIMKIMRHTLDPTLQLMVAGVYGLIAVHVIVNIGAMTGIFPLTGVTLPFLSFGGTSLLFTMLALGVVFSISRYTTHQELTTGKEGIAAHEATVRRRGVGRTRYAGTRRHQ